ncbi:hypothetical protein FHG87_006979 [Trinorchestia longiramus]|nr:hypothetical protein FHG87_006979 [Trinorchestia longiramus]
MVIHVFYLSITDLQLAAELGKTLLERNRNLETTIKQQQTLIDDRDHEIDYLTKQSTALKSVNESRLRIYEQLEISIQELEKTNQRLNNEAAADKRKLRSLQSTIDSLEIRNDELQKALDEARCAARGRLKKKTQALDEALLRRSVSCEHSAQEDRVSGDEDSEAIVENLTAQIRELHAKLTQETNKREEVEIELSTLVQEHEVMLRHVTALHEQQSAPLSLQDELDAMEDSEAASERVCRKCMCSGADTSSNPTVYDLSESIEDEGDRSQCSERGGYLVRLANGGTAWGSQESLASMGQVISQVNSKVTSPATDGSDVAHNSLLNELEGEYRVLIEKYESLVETREEQIREERHKAQQESNRNFNPAEAVEMSGPMSLVLTNGDSGDADESLASMGQVISQVNSKVTSPATDGSDVAHNSLLNELEGEYRVLIEKYESLVETREEQIREERHKAQQESNRNFNPAEAVEMSGPMSLVLTNGDSGDADVPRKCQHCSTCSCGITAPHHRPKSNLEEFSEVETSSSGFSEGESRLSNKMTQTEWLQLERIDETTPVVEIHGLKEVHFLDLKSPVNPCDKRFQTTPGYRKLFKEIFTVLKKSIDENEEISDSEHAPSYTAMSEISVSLSKLNESTCTITEDDSGSTSVAASSKCDEENAVESVASSETVNLAGDTAVEEEKMQPVSNASVIHEEEESSPSVAKLHLRPNSLDLSNNLSSRSPSKQRKQRRQPKSKAELALLKQVEQNASEASKLGKAVIAPPKTKPSSRPEKSKTEVIEREAPPKIIGSKVDLMGLCERHRQLQSKRKNKKNRSRNSSKPRSCLQITSLDELNISVGDPLHPKAEVVLHKPSNGFSRTFHHVQRHQDKLSHTHAESPVNNAIRNKTQPPKINLPSIEVARLRKLEMSYAQVLKAQMERSSNRRAM